MHATECLVSAGMLFALAITTAGAQQQPPQQPQESSEGCFTVVTHAATAAGSILLNRCTGKSWLLVTTRTGSGTVTLRWYPISVETTEPIVSAERPSR
jgi:hypothetical protein